MLSDVTVFYYDRSAITIILPFLIYSSFTSLGVEGDVKFGFLLCWQPVNVNECWWRISVILTFHLSLCQPGTLISSLLPDYVLYDINYRTFSPGWQAILLLYLCLIEGLFCAYSFSCDFVPDSISTDHSHDFSQAYYLASEWLSNLDFCYSFQ